MLPVNRAWRFYPSMSSARETLEGLYALTRALNEESLSLRRALQHVVDVSLNMFDAEHASIRILRRGTMEILSGARAGSGASKKPARYLRGQGVVGWVIDNKETACISDVDEDPRFFVRPEQDYKIRSLLAVPLWSTGEVIGCLSLTSSHKGHFGEKDALLGQLVASCAVPPIERARLHKFAITDRQTKALTHNMMQPALERALKRAKETNKQLSFVLMDLDHFKRVNDNFGHAAGDKVLERFGQLVVSMVRRDDQFIRRGGEEFVVLMPGCGLRLASRAAERIRDALSSLEIELEDGKKITQRVSIGVAEWNRVESAMELEARADSAMYDAKRRGRDRVMSSMPPAGDEPPSSVSFDALDKPEV